MALVESLRREDVAAREVGTADVDAMEDEEAAAAFADKRRGVYMVGRGVRGPRKHTQRSVVKEKPAL